MTTFLVPTDFSANASVALQFAVHMAKEQQAKLLLLHVFNSPDGSALAPHQIMGDERRWLQEDCDKRLREMGVGLQQMGFFNYEYLAVEGATVRCILEVASEKNAQLIVMGTRGAGSIGASFFGSNASHLIEKAKCPVLAIPAEVKPDLNIKRVCFASDYHQSDIACLQQLCEWIRPWQSQLTCLHVSDQTVEVKQEVQLMTKYKEPVLAAVSYPNLAFQILNNNDVEEALLEYIEQGSADLLVLSTHVRRFMDSLYNKSVARSVSLHSRVPLLVFHHTAVASVKLFV
jgi:nucleotide-binding universal stress UspA family protein